MQVAKRLFLIYILLKPFYLFSSGGLQIADIFLIISAVLSVPLIRLNKDNKRRFKQTLIENRLLVLFVTSIALINATYAAIYYQPSFILSTSYYIFNLIAVLLFATFMNDSLFIRKVGTVFKFTLLSQIAFFFTGIGSMYDPTRYMGTFNDPNQFGYFVLLSYFFVYMTNYMLGAKRKTYIYLVAALFLIFLSASAGMMLGIGVFIFLNIVYRIIQLKSLRYMVVRRVAYSLAAIATMALLVVIPFTSIAMNNHMSWSDMVSGQTFIERLMQKIASGGGSSETNLSFWEDRGYDKILLYPEYVLIGAGQGMYERFTQAATNLEVHATFPSMLFYYGVLPFILLIKWVYDKIKDVPPQMMFVCMAIFAESFTLLNQRQSLFWIIIVLVGYVGVYIKKRSKCA
jgi:hypothetical protein